MIRHLVLSGGSGHRFDLTSPLIAQLVAAVCKRSGEEMTTEIITKWTGWSDSFDLVTVNGTGGRFRPGGTEEMSGSDLQLVTPASLTDAFVRHLAAGGAVLAMHSAMMCFADWPDWGEICGATWDPDQSFHPRWAAPVRVRIEAGTQSRSRLRDFHVSDECYHSLRVTGERDVRASASVPSDTVPPIAPPAGLAGIGEPQPVVWTRSHGGGRVGVDTLGHDHRSIYHPAHQVLLGELVRRLLNLD